MTHELGQLLIQALPGDGKGDTPMGALKERRAEALLQAFYLLDDRRVGDEQPIRRLGEAAAVRHGLEGVQGFVVHACIPPFFSVNL